MRKTLLVGAREFRQHVTSRGFLLGAFGLPLILLAVLAFGGGLGGPEVADDAVLQQLMELDEVDETMGYVDRAGLIVELPDLVPPDAFRSYSDVGAAQSALEGGDIEAYYVVSEDYRETGDVERVSKRLPTAPADPQLFDWLLLANVLPGTDFEQVVRFRRPFGGPGPAFVSVDGEDAVEGPGMVMDFLPFVVTIAVMMPLFTSGSYLFQSLTKEKSSRVMEILLVSLRPHQLLTGKILGLGVLILVQYAVWVALSAAALVVTGQAVGQLLAGISLSAGEVALVLPYALGGFGLYAALMAGIGALATDVESSRAWVFIITLPMMIPIYLWMAIVNAPHGALAVALSLFPYSAPVAMLMRMTTASVPGWQLGLSLGLLIVAMVGTLWLMARLFRAQTLLSGEALSVGRFWGALTGP